MNVKELLMGKSECACGKSHICPIKQVVIKPGAIDEIPEMLGKYKNVLLVADENTYKAAGFKVESKIKDKIKSRIVFSGDKILVPNESAIAEIKALVTEECDLVLGVGSGVINDLCKHVSFVSGLPYFIVATAPSMDGYASVGAALILDGMKVTLNDAVPEAIIADTNVLKDAPMNMILAGYGDIIGKYSCLSDWKLSSLVNGEYLCDFVLNATYLEVEKTRKLAKRLNERDPEAITTLMEALVAVGILMAYVGNSRPASGSEHHFSHYFEIVGILFGEEYLPHGIDVFYSAAETAKIREKLISIEDPELIRSSYDRDVYVANIERIYGKLSCEVLALQDRLGWYNDVEKRVAVYKEKWSEIRALLKTAPGYKDMIDMIEEVGMSYNDFVALYGEKKIKDAYLYAKDLKDRYTVLWMYSDLFFN